MFFPFPPRAEARPPAQPVKGLRIVSRRLDHRLILGPARVLPGFSAAPRDSSPLRPFGAIPLRRSPGCLVAPSPRFHAKTVDHPQRSASVTWPVAAAKLAKRALVTAWNFSRGRMISGALRRQRAFLVLRGRRGWRFRSGRLWAAGKKARVRFFGAERETVCPLAACASSRALAAGGRGGVGAPAPLAAREARSPGGGRTQHAALRHGPSRGRASPAVFPVILQRMRSAGPVARAQPSSNASSSAAGLRIAAMSSGSSRRGGRRAERPATDACAGSARQIRAYSERILRRDRRAGPDARVVDVLVGPWRRACAGIHLAPPDARRHAIRSPLFAEGLVVPGGGGILQVRPAKTSGPGRPAGGRRARRLSRSGRAEIVRLTPPHVSPR